MYTAPPIPTPPATTNAPDVLDIDTVVAVTAILGELNKLAEESQNKLLVASICALTS